MYTIILPGTEFEQTESTNTRITILHDNSIKKCAVTNLLYHPQD